MVARNRFRGASTIPGGRINPTVPLVTEGGSHPNLPIKPGLPGVNPVGDVPPIIDTIEIPNPQSDLTSRSVINRAVSRVPSQVSGTVAGRLTRIPWLVGRFRTKAVYLKHYYQGNLGWIFIFGIGMEINQPTKVVYDGREYTPTATTDSFRWTVNLDGSSNDMNIYNGNQDVVDFYLQQLNVINYPYTHEGFSYLVLRIQNLNSWPEIVVVGEGDPDIRTDGLTDTRGYTTNPVWALAKVIEAGSDLDIDWESVETCADYCDELLPTGDKRSEIGLALHRGEYLDEWIAVLREYGYCYVINNGAEVRFICDSPRDSVMDLGNNEIDVGQTQWTRGDLDTTPGNVVVEWENSDTGILDEAYAIDDALDPEDFYDMQGFLTASQARYWASRRYNKMTIRDLSGVMAINAEGVALDFGDVVNVSDRRYRAIQSKLCEVLEVRTGQPGKYELKVIEYQPNVYSGEPESMPESPDTTLPSPYDIATSAAAVTITATSTYNVELQTVVMDLTWTDPDFPFVDGYNIVVTDTDAAPDRIDGTLTVSPRSELSATFSGLQGGTNYTITIRPFNVFSDGFESSETHTTVDDETDPEAPSAPIVTKIAGTSDMVLYFNEASDRDVLFYEIGSRWRTISGPGAWQGAFGNAFDTNNSGSPIVFRGGVNYIALHEGQIRLRTWDRSGNTSTWSDWSDIFTLGP